MTRLNQILIGALVVQVVLVLLLSLRDDDTGIHKLEPLIVDFDPAGVERIQVYDRTAHDDTTTTADEKKEKKGDKPAVNLVKRGKAWSLASHFDFPVETKKVDDLLDKVKSMRSRGPVATGKARIKQLDVADDSYQRKVVITSGGKDLVFYVGASAGARQVSVRLAGKDEVHGVSGLTAYGIGADPPAWVDTSYLELESADVASLDVVNQNGTFSFERSSNPTGWQVRVNGQPLAIPPESELHVDAIDGLLSKVSKIHLAEPGDPKRTVDKPLATLTVRMKAPEPAAGPDGGAPEPATSQSGDEYVIDLAPADAKDRTYAHVRGKETAALVNALSVSDLVELSPTKLIARKGEGKKAPAAPPPGAGMEGLPPGIDLEQLQQQMGGQGQ